MNTIKAVAELQHLLDLLVCPDNDTCYACPHSDECQRLCREIKEAGGTPNDS